jgi:GNAT superfamily N-acetyltransferase
MGAEEYAMAETLPVTQMALLSPVPSGPAAAASPAKTCIISAEIGPEDRQALLDLFARSSPETRRDRFHSALSVFPQLYLSEILNGSQLALAARDTCHEESRGQIIGLASAAPIAPSTAEFAVWMDDAWQGLGVGTLLVRAILRLLAKHGVSTAIGIMEPGNLVVRRLVNRVAPNAPVRSQDGMIVVSVPLAGWATEPDARP